MHHSVHWSVVRHVQASPRQRRRDARVLGRDTAYHGRLRWALEGRGKRGGARVVYYYHSDAMPIFALTAYAKNERADISQPDRKDFRRLTALLVERYARRSR